MQTANNVLTSQMASLESSLTTTQNVISTLTKLQNLKNLITVKSTGTLDAGTISAKSSESIYQKAASALFGRPIGVSVSYAAVSGGASGFLTQMQSIVSQLNTEITNLSANTPVVTGAANNNSLLSTIKIVLRNINSVGAATSLAGGAAYITDNYNAFLNNNINANSGGAYQQNLTNAITAGQSLNTTQTEAVRNFLYIYEEYYKSASAVLQAISQLIQKMAAIVSSN